MVKIKSFLLLPLVNQQEIAPFIDFKTFYQRLEKIVDILEREKEVDLFYDNENIRDFEEPLKELNEDLVSPQSIFASLLSNARDIRGVNFQGRYLVWNFPENHTVLDSQTKLIIKMVEETLLNQSQTPKTQHKYLLLNFTDLCATRAFLPIIKDCGEEKCPQMVCIPQIIDKNKLEIWLSQNRQSRVFNNNPKHGESGKGVRTNKGEQVSARLCNAREAQALLDTAIGCANITDELYNFDRKHGKYIVFKDENTPNNTYHGYHVDSLDEILKYLAANGNDWRALKTKLESLANRDG